MFQVNFLTDFALFQVLHIVDFEHLFVSWVGDSVKKNLSLIFLLINIFWENTDNYFKYEMW